MDQDVVGMIVASKTTTTSTILGELLSLPPLERAGNDDYDDKVNDKANKYSAEILRPRYHKKGQYDIAQFTYQPCKGCTCDVLF